MSEEKTLGEVYEDRNALVLGLAATIHRFRRNLLDQNDGAALEFRACWQPDEGDDADADEWAIVYCWLPTGQVSWHVPRDLAEQSDLPRKFVEWDGHDRAEKNRRLQNFAKS